LFHFQAKAPYSSEYNRDRPWDAYTDDQLGLMDYLGIDKFMVMGLLHWRPLHLESLEAST
jgi:hypothetical protein